jgi:hypothetical protein
VEEKHGNRVVDEIYSYLLDWANSEEYSQYSNEILIALQDFALNKKGSVFFWKPFVTMDRSNPLGS